ERYLSCDGTPDPTVLQELNTFMSLWREDHDEDVQLVMEKGAQVLNLIENLQLLLMDTPPNEMAGKAAAQYQESVLELQDLLQQKYNGATQHLLKTASMYEDSETGNMQAVIKDKNVTFCIWVNLKKKVRFKNHMFNEAQHGFDLPKSLALSSIAIRILHTRYDHKSAVSLKETSNNTEDVKDTGEETEKKSEILDRSSQGIWLVFMCSFAKVLMLNMEEEPRPKVVAAAAENVDLQQLVPVGGVFHIDALQVPPQVIEARDWSMVELLDVGLEVFPYSSEEAEDATESAIQITLSLPEDVVYFDSPLVAWWDPSGQQWRTDGISKIRYEGQEKSITFEMGAFHTVALLQDAHLNMPYKAWELQPAGLDEAFLRVTTFHATIQIQIKGHQCMLSSVAVEEKDVLSHITGKWMSPLTLRAALKRGGVNIFPADYSHNYVPVTRKVSATGNGFLLGFPTPFSLSFCPFLHADLQCRVSEHLEDSARDNWSLYMFNGQKAQKLKITETSEAFSKELEEDSEFHATLYHLLKDLASKGAMDRVEGASFLFSDVVYQLLLATRVLTYS
ncbi:CASC1 protein, partial [Formicarius rufipectus]|nr:CASC1 protein [Formicarius rufipectus]